MVDVWLDGVGVVWWLMESGGIIGGGERRKIYYVGVGVEKIMSYYSKWRLSR